MIEIVMGKAYHVRALLKPPAPVRYPPAEHHQWQRERQTPPDGHSNIQSQAQDNE